MANDIPPWEGKEFESSAKILFEKIERMGQSPNAFNRGIEIGIAQTLATLYLALQSDYTDKLMKRHDEFIGRTNETARISQEGCSE